MTVFTTQWACRNSAISDTSAETNGRADGATSAGFMSGILSTQVSLFPPGANGCRFHSRASGAATCASAKASLGVAWGPAESRVLLPLPTCQNEGYQRVIPSLTRR